MENNKLEQVAQEAALKAYPVCRIWKDDMGGGEEVDVNESDRLSYEEGFTAGAEWDREQMKSYIKKRMEELWEKLPNADKDTFTNEEIKLLGKYMMLEELDEELNGDKKEQYGKRM